MLNNVAEKIRYFRDKLGLTQTDLAKRLGISRSAVNAWEMSLSSPSLANVVELSQIFHVSVDTLLSEGDRVYIDATDLSSEERELVLRLIACFQKEDT
ncbi:MAG: helix-turn-helix transcriptional regulator [Ruminococcaceae bacterium]|nr:helix-turn-helix transcriptional regulator [Oscillospiraceae bacterium]